MRTAASRTRRSHVPRDRGLRNGEGIRKKQRNSSALIPGGITNATPCYSCLFIGAKSASCRVARPASWLYSPAPRGYPRAARCVAFEQHAGSANLISAAGGLQVGVPVELALVEPLQRLAFGDRHASVPDGPLAVSRQGR